MASARLILGTIVIATTLMAPGLGRAQTCTTDADCAKGLSCQDDGKVATTAPCLASDGGTECTPVVTTTPATKSCQAAPCATDADCGTNMVCYHQPSTICTGSAPVTVACAPNTACDAGAVPAPEPPVCTDIVTSTCAYRWEVPCNADADCGDGFTCQPMSYGSCSSGSGTATAGTGTASSGSGVGGGTGSAETPTPVPPPDVVDAGVATPVTCTEVTSYPGSCVANPVSCSADADCPSGWTCALVTTGTAVSDGTSTTPGAPVAVDGGAVVAPPPVVTTTTGTCRPPTIRNPGGTTTDGTYDSPKTGGTVDLAAADAGASQASTTPPSPTVPSTPAANDPGTTTQTAASTGGGGCNVGAGATGGPLGLLAALGVLGILVARRRRAP
jgi:MYXO-CTERM domain-containing protein